MRRLSRRDKKLLSSLGVAAALAAALSPWLLLEIAERPPIYRHIYARWQGARYLGEEGVIRQSTPYDCGTASLLMILIRRGISATSTTIKSASGANDNGTSMLGIKAAAERYGLEASIWKLRERDLSRAPLPLIAFVDGSHFVVVDSFTAEGRLIVLDPAAGRLEYTPQSFAKHWRGEAILFSNHEAFD